jgi:hypothetical protein
MSVVDPLVLATMPALLVPVALVLPVELDVPVEPAVPVVPLDEEAVPVVVTVRAFAAVAASACANAPEPAIATTIVVTT